jgi:hypothetical protein
MPASGFSLQKFDIVPRLRLRKLSLVVLAFTALLLGGTVFAQTLGDHLKTGHRLSVQNRPTGLA